MPRENDVEKLCLAHKDDRVLARAVADLVWRSEMEPVMGKVGKWVLDTEGLTYLMHRSGRGHFISKRDEGFAAYMAYEYGLAQSDYLTKVVIDRLRGRCVNESPAVPTARFAFWDREQKFLCLSLYNRRYVKLSGTGGTGGTANGITAADNGADVIFLDDDVGFPLSDSDLRRGFSEAVKNPSLYKTLTGGMTLSDEFGDPELQRKLYFLWFLSTCFPQWFSNKHLAVFVGEKGSGKTTAIEAAQIIQKGVHNVHILQRSDEATFWIKLLRSPVCGLDNLDNMFPWLEDLLCAYATQGTWERKKLYADTDRVLIRPQAFIAATTRVPSNFSRIDVADRSIFLSFQRQASFISWKDRLKGMRAPLFAELIGILNRIVDVLKSYEQRETPYRMTEFANFCYAVAPVLQWGEGEIDKILAMAEEARQMISGTIDPVVSILIAAVSKHPEKTLSGTAAEVADRYLAEECRQRGKPLPDARELGRVLTGIGRGGHSFLKVTASPAHGNVFRYTVTARGKTNEAVDTSTGGA